MTSRASYRVASAALLAATGVIIALSPGVHRRGAIAIVGRDAPAQDTRAKPSTASLPLYFERNDGQTDASVRFLVHGERSSLFLTDDAAVVTMVAGDAAEPLAAGGLASGPRGPRVTRGVARIGLVGASRNPRMIGLDPLAGRVNYLIGDDPARWHTDIPIYARVRIAEVYPGVDLTYYGTSGALEYDLAVAPGADPSRIRLAIEGPVTAALDAHGDLQIATAAGTIAMRKPRIHQVSPGGGRTTIDGSFVLASERTAASGLTRSDLTIRLGAYDRSRPLVIDPVIDEVLYSTYLGGHASSLGPVNLEQFSGITNNLPIVVADVGLALALDSANDAYVAGVAYSNDFPTLNPFQAQDQGANPTPVENPNAFISKFDPTRSGAASLIYSTYLGGEGDTARADAGHGNGDLPFGIAVDGSGQAYVVGQTYSTDFPAAKSTCGSFGRTNDQNHTFTNVGFIAKLNPAGNGIVYSCYIDGKNNATEARVALFPPGCSGSACKAYIAGSTQSDIRTGFPATPNAFQKNLLGTHGKSNATFVVVHEDGQSLDYATLYGGTGNGINADSGLGVAVDANGLGYITGATYSADLKVPNGAFTTYEGGANLTPNVFVAQFNPSLTGDASLPYATYLGGHGAVGMVGPPVNFKLPLGDIGTGLAVDPSGHVWVTGLTASTDFRNIPGTVAPVYQSLNQAATSAGPPATAAFVTEINPAAAGANQILYSSYFGGTGVTFSFPPAASGTIGFGDVATDIYLANAKVYLTGATASGQFLQGIQGFFPLTPDACYTTNQNSGVTIVRNPRVNLAVTAWAAELDPSQPASEAQLAFSTLLGGSGPADAGAGVRVTSDNNLVVDGFTYSTDFPLTPNGFQLGNAAAGRKASNAFLTVLNPAGNTCPTPFPTPTPGPSATATPGPPIPLPKLVVTPNQVTFPPIGIDRAKPATRPVKVHNAGKALLMATVENLMPPFGTQNAPLNLVVPAGMTRQAIVTFQPTQIGAAMPQTLVITSNDPLTPQEAVMVTGIGAPGTMLVATTLRFPPTMVGLTAKKPQLAIRNSGIGVLHVSYSDTLVAPLMLEGGSQSNVAIAPGKSLILTIDFTPEAKGPVTAQNLTITSDDPNHSSVIVSIGGSGK